MSSDKIRPTIGRLCHEQIPYEIIRNYSTDMNIAKDCQEHFSVFLPSAFIAKRTEKFLAKLNKSRLLAALSNRLSLYRIRS